MSRGFFGGGGGKKSNSGSRGKGMMGKLTSFKRSRTLQEMVDDKNTHRVKTHKEMVDDLFDQKMYEPRKKYGFTMPGTAPAEEREMTKGQIKAMEILRNKKNKKRVRLNDKKVRIVAKAYGEGRLTESGKILDKMGAIILQVNPDTGIITNKLGLKVGKYDPNSSSNAFKIERLIQKFSTQNIKFNPFAPK